MVLYEDTRQQAGKHKNIHAYCRETGIRIIRQALNVGDYQIAGKGDISVDTKQGVLELAGNIFQEHERFRAECLRAQECGIQLIILVEEALRKAMITMQREYSVKFRFCDGRSTGKQLVEYLKGERT